MIRQLAVDKCEQVFVLPELYSKRSASQTRVDPAYCIDISLLTPPKILQMEVRYTLVARFLHWLIAALIICQYVIAELAESAEDADQLLQQLALLANHKSIGMTVFFLAFLRLGWRLTHRAPALPVTMPGWQKVVSATTHWLIYALIFLIPLSGWLMSSATGYSVSWFNLFVFPDLVATSDLLEERFHTIHEFAAEALFVLVCLHVLAALKHQFIDKDGLLRRIADWQQWALFAGVLVIVLALFARINTSSSGADSASAAGDTDISVETSSPASSLPVWNIDFAQSHIRFTGDQAGAPFTGEWQQWQADLQFDAADLGNSRFDVRIDTGSAFSNDEERDEAIASVEFFDAETFNEARFYSDGFSANGDSGFIADGRLTVKQLTKPLPFQFTLEESEEGSVVLRGSAIIDRLAWNIGTGDWTDTTWVGQDVQVDVLVSASKP